MSVIGERTEGDVEILDREVAASTTQWMKVCTRDTGGVMTSGGGERVTPVMMSNRSRDVMTSSRTVVDADAEDGEEKVCNCDHLMIFLLQTNACHRYSWYNFHS